MKASLKFREEQKPLLRAKIPLNILGMPFQSGIVAGDSKELTLNLATFFQSGPSIKLSYRPNDSKNPFSLIVKTGTGPFRSPLFSSMLMSCEFNLLGNGVGGNWNSGSPVFMLHFKPQFGDFSFKKSQSSVFVKKKGFGSVIVGNGNGYDDDVVSIEGVESPLGKGIGKVPIFGGYSPAAGAIAGVFSGMEVAAWTKIPVMERAEVKFRWGVRVPKEMKTTASGLSFQNAPFLVMDKVAVEHLADVGGGDSRNVKGKGVAGDLSFPASGDVAEACLTVKRQLDVLQSENGLLRNAVEDLRREFAGGSGGLDIGKYREFERNGVKGKVSDARKSERKSSDFPSRSTEAEASDELKKALMGATGA